MRRRDPWNGRQPGPWDGRVWRSPPLAYGYLAAGLGKLGHTVEYCLDDTPAADVYIFNPALMTLPFELEVIRRLNERSPSGQPN